MASLSRVVDRVTDCHCHLRSVEEIAPLVEACHGVGFDTMNIVCGCTHPGRNSTPQAFAAKATHPELFTVFAGLDHSAWWSQGQVRTPSLADQVDRLVSFGADGIKLLETKPTSRDALPIPSDDAYFEAFFERVEECGLPLVWHVADPEEFWDPARTPAWAATKGWGYDDSVVSKEALYAEVQNVLARHPALKAVFAHFYFLSADLPRAGAFLDAYPNVLLDLAPGIEMCHNLSADPGRSREFFVAYAERIVFGTDISSSQSLRQARARADIVRRWLETDEAFAVGPEADELLGEAEDGPIVGLSLPPEALGNIYHENFSRLIGSRRVLDADEAARECRRLADVASHLGVQDGKEEALRAAEVLSATGPGPAT